MKQLLKFHRLDKTGKTEQVQVYSAHSDDFLGTIHWRSGWRCYVISYEDNIDMSVSCMKELNTFMEELEEVRQRELKEKGAAHG